MKRLRYCIFLITATALATVGWLGYSYESFRINFGEHVLAGEIVVAEKIYLAWETGLAFKILEHVSFVRENGILSKAWLLVRTGDFAGAIREYSELPEASVALYNGATVSLVEGDKSVERLAEKYIKVLQKNPDDFQARVNLEIVRVAQEQSKQKSSSSLGKGKEDKKEGKLRYRPGDNSGGGDDRQGFRY